MQMKKKMVELDHMITQRGPQISSFTNAKKILLWLKVQSRIIYICRKGNERNSCWSSLGNVRAQTVKDEYEIDERELGKRVRNLIETVNKKLGE